MVCLGANFDVFNTIMLEIEDMAYTEFIHRLARCLPLLYSSSYLHTVSALFHIDMIEHVLMCVPPTNSTK
ncbi:hypothetical protein BLOT_016268 [Blomia tropicalis]|nr:hypothetical protein BLOT_016268 [Blomia tropicalis]